MRGPHVDEEVGHTLDDADSRRSSRTSSRRTSRMDALRNRRHSQLPRVLDTELAVADAATESYIGNESSIYVYSAYMLQEAREFARAHPRAKVAMTKRAKRGGLVLLAMVCCGMQFLVMLCFDFSVTMPSCSQHSDCEFSGSFCHPRYGMCMICPPWDGDKQEIVVKAGWLFSNALDELKEIQSVFEVTGNVSGVCLDDSLTQVKPYCAYSDGAKKMGPFDLVVLCIVTMVISLEVVKELDQLQLTLDIFGWYRLTPDFCCAKSCCCCDDCSCGPSFDARVGNSRQSGSVKIVWLRPLKCLGLHCFQVPVIPASAQRMFRLIPMFMTFLVAPTLLVTFLQQVLLVGGDAKSQVIDSLSLVFLLELDNIVFKFIGPEKHSRYIVGVHKKLKRIRAATLYPYHGESRLPRSLLITVSMMVAVANLRSRNCVEDMEKGKDYGMNGQGRVGKYFYFVSSELAVISMYATCSIMAVHAYMLYARAMARGDYLVSEFLTDQECYFSQRRACQRYFGLGWFCDLCWEAQYGFHGSEGLGESGRERGTKRSTNGNLVESSPDVNSRKNPLNGEDFEMVDKRRLSTARELRELSSDSTGAASIDGDEGGSGADAGRGTVSNGARELPPSPVMLEPLQASPTTPPMQTSARISVLNRVSVQDTALKSPPPAQIMAELRNTAHQLAVDDKWGNRPGDRGSDASMAMTEMSAVERDHGALNEEDAMDIRKITLDLVVDIIVSGFFINVWEFFQFLFMYMILENEHPQK